MVAAAPVDGAAHRITDQPGLESRCLEPFVASLLWRERGLGLAVGDEFHAEEQAASANVADMRVLCEP